MNDDEQICHELINVKMVPILQFDDGTAMGESLDIVKELDRRGKPEKVLRPGHNHPLVTAHIDKVSLSINCLLFPRYILLGLPEFETQNARDYFQFRKEANIGRSFEQALAESDEHKRNVEQMLTELPTPELPSHHGNTIGLDDVLIYPTLRNLTAVKDIQIPTEIRRYIDEVTLLTDSHTYYSRAV
ncbi:glutaredoxin 2 [Gynuella sunshinyii YC6258]|uniref:Glutaredoxin 2 n=1 Tax=Gynuella sunshinyii YC6258 TaxID=1445510 RepID=A0A0C5VNQ7_9GAMM|nr:glutaredoxin 2 [Gynuella sunshinyii YC6258]